MLRPPPIVKKYCGISSVYSYVSTWGENLFLSIWPLLIIPQSTNKSQTHILSCLSCAASLLQCVMSKKCYQLFKGQRGGCFLWEDTWCLSPAITEPTITSLTCPSLIGLEHALSRITAEGSVSQGCCWKSEQDNKDCSAHITPSHSLTDVWTGTAISHAFKETFLSRKRTLVLRLNYGYDFLTSDFLQLFDWGQSRTPLLYCSRNRAGGCVYADCDFAKFGVGPYVHMPIYQWRK